MNLAELRASVGPRRKRRRVGRGPGSTRGKTSGRGHKGYGQRSGSGGRLLYEGGQMPLYRRLPKKGFSSARFKKAIAIINVRELNRFADGAEVTLARLQELGLRGREYRTLKILGEGELTRKLVVTANRFSSSALTKIRAAGGEARLVQC
ncbi:MAG: 50S ribosomal protein L15 [Planctomycetes bacterium]|nr:50S ribosomal protein L15 [Planctomycetota bacterium]